MPAITIKGIRLESLDIEYSAETGAHNLKGAAYSLISSADRVLARQNLGGYNDMKIAPSSNTLTLLNEFVSSYKKDVTAALGLEEA